jgi:penicillin amidase
LRANSSGGAVYQVFKHELLELLLSDALPPQLRYALRGQGGNPLLLKFNEFLSHETPMLLRLLRNPQSSWWNKHKPEQALVLALERSMDELEKRLGKDPKQWQWGKLHAMVLKHTLGQQAPLDEIFNLGPFNIGGDADTLCQLSYMPGEHYGGEIMGASYRQIIDLGNLGNSMCISPTGQSGNRLSPHYADQTPMWLNGQLKPMVWTKEQILEHGQFKTILQPE